MRLRKLLAKIGRLLKYGRQEEQRLAIELVVRHGLFLLDENPDIARQLGSERLPSAHRADDGLPARGRVHQDHAFVGLEVVLPEALVENLALRLRVEPEEIVPLAFAVGNRDLEASHGTR